MAKEKRLIDANALMKNGWHLVQTGESNRFLQSMSLADVPTVDAVSRGVLDRVRWERDIAIGQLESYGVSLGEKADVVKAVHGHWVASGCGFDCCSECRKVYADGYLTAMGIKPRTQFNYCPNCGADMRERKDND